MLFLFPSFRRFCFRCFVSFEEITKKRRQIGLCNLVSKRSLSFLLLICSVLGKPPVYVMEYFVWLYRQTFRANIVYYRNAVLTSVKIYISTLCKYIYIYILGYSRLARLSILAADVVSQAKEIR